MEYRYLKVAFPLEGVALLTLNSPKTLNALNSALLEEMNLFLDAIPKQVRVLVITGEGKAFVAGADISQMIGLTAEEAFDFSVLGAGVFSRIENLPIPVIAAVNGFALGGGCELAMACDIRWASEKARFGQPEVKLGIIPGFSGTYRLPKLVGQGMAKEMIYSGRMYDAQDALRTGLVTNVLEEKELLPSVLELAANIAANAPMAVHKAKVCINAHDDLSSKDDPAVENRAFSECFTTQDQKTGMQAFLEKRKPEFINK